MDIFKFDLKCTKIVATIGPSITLKLDSSSARSIDNPDYKEVVTLLNNLFWNGLNCIRFNFSHSNDEERLFRLEVLRGAKKHFFYRFNQLTEQDNSKLSFVIPISALCDTKGPEIRVGKMGLDNNGQQYYRGQTIKVHCIEPVVGDQYGFFVTDSTCKYNMATDCIVGQKILVDDGKLSLLIKHVDVELGIVEVLVENDHFLKFNKRVNLPNADYSLPFLSEKDKNDIIFSVKEGFAVIALSFVNKIEDVLEVRKLVNDNCHPSKPKPIIITKVETAQCLKNIDSIISVSDGIMIARGDLALESPYYDVPFWTKEILRKSAKAGKPVIIATQMLDSLERAVVPTRAEVSDVYRAAELSSDSTMLSGETAQGLFPLIAIKTMSEIVQSGELRCNYDKLFDYFVSDCENQRLLELGKSLFFNKSKFDSIIACFLFEGSVQEEDIFYLSRLKLPFPFIIFSKKSNYSESESNLNAQISSIYRGIYRISVLNTNNESLENCARKFLNLCGEMEGGVLIESSSYKKEFKVIAIYENNLVNLVNF